VTEVDYSCIACLLMLRADGPSFHHTDQKFSS